MATSAAHPKQKSETPASEKGKPRLAYILDSTCTQESGPRKHAQLIDGVERTFTFSPGEPLEMPLGVAGKFLRHPEFKLCDKDGTVLVFKRRPKQPDELQAGEKIELKLDETIARYEELSAKALFSRVVELPGGEKFANAEKPPIDEMIAFIVAHKAKNMKVNAGNPLTPEASADDDVLVDDSDDED